MWALKTCCARRALWEFVGGFFLSNSSTVKNVSSSCTMLLVLYIKQENGFKSSDHHQSCDLAIGPGVKVVNSSRRRGDLNHKYSVSSALK